MLVGRGARLGAEREVLAEVPPVLVLDRIGHGLAARVVVARVVMPAVDAAPQIAPARFTFGVARDRLADGDRRAAEVALRARHARERACAAWVREFWRRRSERELVTG